MTDSETTDCTTSTTAPDAATLLARCRRATDDAPVQDRMLAFSGRTP